ncbi:BTAD domain-containing putative transcriptional regulator [Amycolatopsis coloradensis]|uniref:BTAD domain-containing putative transcriptional regulator n=1 Tax=Amycolatopsis coloradensis TaxID=76021 RepID=A0ACD5BJK6_9PSEU
MEVNLLGPLEVFREGVVITPSAPKLRRMFSLLALQANNLVRTNQIIDELWEDRPTASAATTLQTYIYQLRKLLQLSPAEGVRSSRPAGADGAALHTLANGYVLALPSNSLDSRLFEQLAKRSRGELESGTVETASKTLEEALRLWRGPALADVSTGPVLDAEIRRLEELRKGVLEQRIEVDLQLGKHNELLGELTMLGAQYPTHEGFQAKLMLALYRAGRQAEALHVYHRTRDALATELGLDPTDSLQRLQRAVLSADQSLSPPTPGPGTVVTRRSRPPRQLPPDGTVLIGRRAESTAALEALCTGRGRAATVVVIVGPPGVGKTALCNHVAHQVVDRYPDGQFYAKLLDDDGSPVEPGEVLAGFLRAAGVTDERIPASTDERSRMFRTWTTEHRVLLALDDAVSAEQLLPLLPSSAECGVLVTTRRRLFVAATSMTVELLPLTEPEGIQLLTGVLGSDRVAKNDRAARELVKLCDGLPLALHWAAGQLQVRQHWAIARSVHRLSAAIDDPSVDTDILGLRASVERSYSLARPGAQDAFRKLAKLDNPSVSVALAARMLEVEEQHAESLLEDLAELWLIDVTAFDERIGHTQYRFLPSLRAIGRRLSAREELCLMA